MHLGDEAKFKYDPVKKRYVFDGEEEESEEDNLPPPTAPSFSRKNNSNVSQ